MALAAVAALGIGIRAVAAAIARLRVLA